MEKIVEVIYDKKQLLWYNALKRAVEGHEYLGRILYGETFLAAIRKLREIDILENNSMPNKAKRVPIRLTFEAYEKYKIGSLRIPNTYQPGSEIDKKKFKRQQTIRKRRRRDSGHVHREKIIQSFLFRAAIGCHYSIDVTGRPRQKGDYTIFKDVKGHFHGPRDMIYLTDEQKNRLIPVIGDGFSLSGVSIKDLVHQRDSSGIFRYLRVTTKEAKKILCELIDSHILVPLKKSDVRDIFAETRYVIVDPLLSKYISEHYGLLSWVLQRMESIWLTDHPTREDIEWYMYYYGMPLTSNYFDNIKKVIVADDYNNSQIELCDQIIVKSIEAMRNNVTYDKVRSNHKALCNTLKKTIEPFCKSYIIYHEFFNF